MDFVSYHCFFLQGFTKEKLREEKGTVRLFTALDTLSGSN